LNNASTSVLLFTTSLSFDPRCSLCSLSAAAYLCSLSAAAYLAPEDVLTLLFPGQENHELQRRKI